MRLEFVNNKTVYLAGQRPKDGTVLKYKSQLGTDLSTDQRYDAAKLCAFRLVSVLHAAAHGLENDEHILKLIVFVNIGTIGLRASAGGERGL